MIALAALEEPQGQGHILGRLALHVEQIAPHHPIGIDDQIVKGFLLGWGARRAGNRCRHIENRDDLRMAADALPQQGRARFHTLIPIEIDPDRLDSIGPQAINRPGQQGILQRPTEAPNVLLRETDQANGPGHSRWRRPQNHGRVVDQQVERFTDTGQLESP